MDLTQLANLGGFIGGVAVLVTLAYLAVQTRNSRSAVEQSALFAGLQASGAVIDQYGRWRVLAVPPSRLSLAVPW